MEFGEKAGLRFISCKELPEHMIGKDVFVLPSAVEHCRDWAAGTQVSFHLLEQKGTGKPQADQLKLLGGASSSGAGRRTVLRRTDRGDKADSKGDDEKTLEKAAWSVWRNSGSDDPRLEEYIELNSLDPIAKKALRHCSSELQAVVIEKGMSIQENGDMQQKSASHVVMARVKIEKAKIMDRIKNGELVVPPP
ncbi:unnamed protein product, partial [Polarella glacialis]